MYKYKLPLISQEYLAYQLGLIVSPESRKLFWKFRTGKKPKSGYGTQIDKKEFNPNTVFPKLKIPLRMTYHSARDFTAESLLNFLEEGEKKNKNLLVCFDVGALENSKHHGGHVCVFDRVDKKKAMIRLIDPSQNQPKWRLIALKDLYRGMTYHWNKSGGVWEFELKR